MSRDCDEVKAMVALGMIARASAEQAALFNLGAKVEDNAEQSTHGDHDDK